MMWKAYLAMLMGQEGQISTLRQILIDLVPDRDKCEKLVLYYCENIDWIFQSIHITSF
ncbi:hypothetical protein BX600DRAFT_475816 [Xylariales sp. PMI_506]|nr:hypothetical protein BX600DRAFT_475816 [Xylariales sp. PMI_506]